MNSEQEGTFHVHATRTRPPVEVSADGVGVVSHVGSRLLADLADQTTLTGQLSAVFARRTAPQTAHDPGRVLTDLAVMLADGGEAISDIATLADQSAVFGPVASDSTCWRVLNSITRRRPGRDRGGARGGAVRWRGRSGPSRPGTRCRRRWSPARRCSTATGRPVLVIDDDATIVVTHSREGTHRGDVQALAMAITRCWRSATTPTRRWPGCCGRATPAPTPPPTTSRCSMQALAQIPDEYRHGYPILVRADGAGASKAFLAHIRALRNSGVRSEFSIGWAVTDREHTAIAALPARAWTPAVDIDGDPRESASVAELTGALPAAMFADYPPGTRIIVRRERPHPGAQLDLIEHRDGWRYTCFATDTRTGQHAWLDARHRSHARVEDRIRCGKDTGLGRMPVPAVRDQRRLADLRADRDRPARLDPDHPAARRPRTGQGRTEDAALPTAARRRPARPRRPQTPTQDRPHLALGTRARRRLPPTTRTAHPRDLNRRPRPCDTHGQPGNRARATGHAHRRSRTADSPTRQPDDTRHNDMNDGG